MTEPALRTPVRVRELGRADLDAVIRIDAAHTGEAKPEYWRRVFDESVGAEAPGAAGRRPRSAGDRGGATGGVRGGATAGALGGGAAGTAPAPRVGLAAERDGDMIAYLLGEVRAFEFGSEPCGWVFAIGVDPGRLQAGVATTLLADACRRFRDAGVTRVRTMVRRNDLPVLSFFRANGFVGGSFVQLEVDLRDDATEDPARSLAQSGTRRPTMSGTRRPAKSGTRRSAKDETRRPAERGSRPRGGVARQTECGERT